VITWYLTASFMGLRLWGAMLARTVHDEGAAGWIPPAMVARIARNSLARCDALDGVADGLVGNPDGCRRGAAAAMEALRCCAGETGNPETCLTEAQTPRTMRVYHGGDRLPCVFANGVTGDLGYHSPDGIAMQLGSQRGGWWCGAVRLRGGDWHAGRGFGRHRRGQSGNYCQARKQADAGGPGLSQRLGQPMLGGNEPDAALR
jgi:hypothetical protein